MLEINALPVDIEELEIVPMKAFPLEIELVETLLKVTSPVLINALIG